MEVNPKKATGIHVNCVSCARRMYLSLLTAKKLIAKEDIIELNAVLQGVKINDTNMDMEVEAEELEEISDVVVATEDGAGQQPGVGGRQICIIHSDRTRRLAGCYVTTKVPLADFKGLVRIVEEARAGV